MLEGRGRGGGYACQGNTSPLILCFYFASANFGFGFGVALYSGVFLLTGLLFYECERYVYLMCLCISIYMFICLYM